MRNSSTLHMTTLGILVPTSLMLHYMAHTIGQTCAVTSRNPISPPVRNASKTNYLTHRNITPLPVPNEHGDSVAIDFVIPLPLDEGHDCILTMTD
jgi:hypothetical protein